MSAATPRTRLADMPVSIETKVRRLTIAVIAIGFATLLIGASLLVL